MRKTSHTFPAHGVRQRFVSRPTRQPVLSKAARRGTNTGRR